MSRIIKMLAIKISSFYVDGIPLTFTQLYNKNHNNLRSIIKKPKLKHIMTWRYWLKLSYQLVYIYKSLKGRLVPSRIVAFR